MAKIDTNVGHLVDMIERGELRLPELQRRYVWPATRVRDLLDSLYRGYPSGTILVWETDQEVPSRDLVVQQTSSAFTPKLLLDGQQRLTSLSAVIRGEPIRLKGRVRPIHIAFNLDHPEGPPVEVMEVEDDEQPPAFEQVEEEGEEPAEAKSLQERLRSRTFVVGSNAPAGYACPTSSRAKRRTGSCSRASSIRQTTRSTTCTPSDSSEFGAFASIPTSCMSWSAASLTKRSRRFSYA